MMRIKACLFANDNDDDYADDAYDGCNALDSINTSIQAQQCECCLL